MSSTSELTHLFRAMKAPAAARALEKLAERARSEEWSYERFTEALLSTCQGPTRIPTRGQIIPHAEMTAA